MINEYLDTGVYVRSNELHLFSSWSTIHIAIL